MVCEGKQLEREVDREIVLILVLMEYGLRVI